VRQLVDEHVFYCLPMLSPGRDSHFYDPNDTNSRASGLAPSTRIATGYREDGPDDLNGDGVISRMRKRDPHGRRKKATNILGCCSLRAGRAR